MTNAHEDSFSKRFCIHERTYFQVSSRSWQVSLSLTLRSRDWWDDQANCAEILDAFARRQALQNTIVERHWTTASWRRDDMRWLHCPSMSWTETHYWKSSNCTDSDHAVTWQVVAGANCASERFPWLVLQTFLRPRDLASPSGLPNLTSPEFTFTGVWQQHKAWPTHRCAV